MSANKSKKVPFNPDELVPADKPKKIPPVQLDQPNRAGLNELTTGLCERYTAYRIVTSPTLDKLQDRLRALEDEFYSRAHIRHLKKEIDRVEREFDSFKKKMEKKARYIRHKYLANGGTPGVIKLINAFIDEINNGHE